MAGRITIAVTKGQGAGERFVYTEKEALIVGRKKNCAIRFGEMTVSRYHCLLDIAPPSVMVRDFGSRNGTTLNGETIGKRPDDMSAEEAQKMRFNEYEVANGARLGIGPACEMLFKIEYAVLCFECGAFIRYDDKPGKTGEIHYCDACAQKRAAQEAAQLEKEREVQDALRQAEKEFEQARQNARPPAQKKKSSASFSVTRCAACGSLAAGLQEGAPLCRACKNDPVKVITYLIKTADDGMPETEALRGYEIIDKLGEGGMAQVWLVEQRGTGRRMALKLMLPQVAAEEDKRSWFLREAHLLGQLEHPNIVRQTASGGVCDMFFILMEYCNGGDVDDILERNGYRLGIDKASEVMLQALEGLAYAHTAPVRLIGMDASKERVTGVVHRDFKPSNIFISDDNGVLTYKVADFGLAKAFECAGYTSHTMTGQGYGTFFFMPRSQILNYRYAKPDVDVWSAMATYYAMLTGKPARRFKTGEDYAYTVLHRDATPIREREPSIPRRLADVIDAALVESDDGPSALTARELISQIKDALR